MVQGAKMKEKSSRKKKEQRGSNKRGSRMRDVWPPNAFATPKFFFLLLLFKNLWRRRENEEFVFSLSLFSLEAFLKRLPTHPDVNRSR